MKTRHCTKNLFAGSLVLFSLVISTLISTSCASHQTVPESVASRSIDTEQAIPYEAGLLHRQEIELGRCPSSAVSCTQVFDQLALKEPQDRFLGLFDTLSRDLNGATGNADKVITALDSEKTRGVLLHLQALARLYHILELKGAKDLNEDFASIEAEIGNIQRFQALNSIVSESTYLTPTEKQAVSQKVILARERAAKVLEVEKWLPDPTAKLAELSKRIKKMEFQKLDKDKRALVKALAVVADETRYDLGRPEMRKIMMKTEYDQEDLDSGPHRMRRKLRWYTTMMQAAKGVFEFKNPGLGSERLVQLKHELGDSKYLRLAPPLENPALLNMEPIYEVALQVTKLGLMKDFKEAQLDLRDILIELGYKKKAAAKTAQAVLVEKFGPMEVEPLAHQLYQQYLSADPLKAIRKNLESELERLKDTDR
jgi:hypothetical protein